MRYPEVCCLNQCIRSTWRTGRGFSRLELWLWHGLSFGTSICWEGSTARIGKSLRMIDKSGPLELMKGIYKVYHYKYHKVWDMSNRICTSLYHSTCAQDSWIRNLCNQPSHDCVSLLNRGILNRIDTKVFLLKVGEGGGLQGWFQIININWRNSN